MSEPISITLTPEQARELEVLLRNNRVGVVYSETKALYISDFDNVGKQLRNIRLKQGVALSDLSKQVGITHAFMCKVEHNQMKLTKTRQLIAWCKGLGYDEVYLKLR